MHESVSQEFVNTFILKSKIESNISKVGSYLIKELLGEGGQATVFKGLNMKENYKPYAIKKFTKELRNDKDRLETVRSEATLMRKLNHPNILKAYEVMETQNNFYIVLEFCKKGGLNNLIDKEPLSESRAVFFLQQIMNGLYELREQRILHRDIKLGNILVTGDNIIKISDFGFSVMAEVSTQYAGTRSHMAPEILFHGQNRKNIKYDYKADLWSTGVVFYELLHRKCPFEGREISQIIENILKFAGKNLRFNSNISEEAKELLVGLLTIDPEQRFGWQEFYGHRIFRKYKEQRVDSALKQSILAQFQSIHASNKFKATSDFYEMEDLIKMYQFDFPTAHNSVDENCLVQKTGGDQNGLIMMILDGMKEVGHVYMHEINKLNFMLFSVQQIVVFMDTYNYSQTDFQLANLSFLLLKLAQIFMDKLLVSVRSRENYLELSDQFFRFILNEENGINGEIIKPKFEYIEIKLVNFGKLLDSYKKVITKIASDKKVGIVFGMGFDGRSLTEHQIFGAISNQLVELQHYSQKKVLKENQKAFAQFNKIRFFILNVLEINKWFPYFVDMKNMVKFNWRDFRREIEFVSQKDIQEAFKGEKIMSGPLRFASLQKGKGFSFCS